MGDHKENTGAGTKINTAREVPLFSKAQLSTFNSDYVDSLDEALAVLDEDNKSATGQTGNRQPRD